MTSRLPARVHAAAGLLAAPLLLGGAVAGGAAHAEERDPFAPRPPLPLLRDDVAGTRQIPGYGAPGIRAGIFTLSPEVTLRADADSNVLNSRTDRRGDLAFTVAPALSASTEAGGAHLSLGAQFAATRHARLKAQDRETFALQAQGAGRLGSVLELGLAAGWARKEEPNWSAGAAAADSPTLYQQLSGTLALAGSLGAARLSARLDLDRMDYLPVTRAGLRADQSYRDQRVMAATVRAEHALPAGRLLFLQASHRWADSLHPAPLLDRTSRGGEVLAGLRGDLTHLVSAEIAGGYQWRHFRSSAFRNWGGAAFRAKVEWYATPLVSVQLSARRDVVDAGIATSAGVVMDSAQARVFYELRRNLNLVASAGLTRESYRDNAAAGLVARSASAGLEARYALSGKYLVGAYARYRNRSSDSALLPRLGGAAEGGLWLRLKL